MVNQFKQRLMATRSIRSPAAQAEPTVAQQSNAPAPTPQPATRTLATVDNLPAAVTDHVLDYLMRLVEQDEMLREYLEKLGPVILGELFSRTLLLLSTHTDRYLEDIVRPTAATTAVSLVGTAATVEAGTRPADTVTPRKPTATSPQGTPLANSPFFNTLGEMLNTIPPAKGSIEDTPSRAPRDKAPQEFIKTPSVRELNQHYHTRSLTRARGARGEEEGGDSKRRKLD